MMLYSKLREDIVRVSVLKKHLGELIGADKRIVNKKPTHRKMGGNYFRAFSTKLSQSKQLIMRYLRADQKE